MFHPRYNALTRDVALISGSSSTIQKKKTNKKGRDSKVTQINFRTKVTIQYKVKTKQNQE